MLFSGGKATALTKADKPDMPPVGLISTSPDLVERSLSLVIEILDDAKIWNHFHKPNTGNHPDDGAGDGVSSYALPPLSLQSKAAA